MIIKDRYVSRKAMAEKLKVSEKTITRYIKTLNVKFVGKGKNGYWHLKIKENDGNK